jgi:hypothetical protein
MYIGSTLLEECIVFVFRPMSGVEAMCLSETLVQVHQTTFLGAFARLLKVTYLSYVCLSAQNNSTPTKCDVLEFFGTVSRKLRFH